MSLKVTIPVLTLSIATSVLAENTKYFCYGEDGSDISISIDLKKAKATFTSEEEVTNYAFSGTFESLPPGHVFGDRQECYIIFSPSRDNKSGVAAFRCNQKKYPNALKLDMTCFRE